MATMTTEMHPFYTSSTSHMSHAPAAVDKLLTKYSSSMTNTSNSLLNRRQNPFQRVIDRVRLEYYRYEVTFGLYVMTPSEKCVANTFVFVVISLLLWALLLYFPPLLYNKLARVIWLLTGHSGEGVTAALGVLDMNGNAFSPTSIAEAPLAS
ncbi:hypothetical protein N7532_005108 [Penicillium argentinense]|uniref:Uncharacterized protein n=1 Tax=Penicillium argentinense TaxID=1131581 RepID=A0A9W9FDU6_9EURO|nr:uncharacterized protein N7532_005108 [Penicillium argentinense]KAJ5098107.1 hypothetical protein N7532_005108 [Penicillium argentinense]